MSDVADLVPLVESFHIAERRLVWVTDDVCVFRSGCGLVFLNTRTRHQQLLHIPVPYILDAFAVTPPAVSAAASASSSSPSPPQIAVALHGQECVIRLYSFPQLELVQSIAAAEAAVAFTALTFTSHSHLLAGTADSLHYYHCPSSSLLTSSPLPRTHAAAAPVTLLLPCPFLPSRCLSLSSVSAALHLTSALSSFQPPLLHHTTISISQPLFHTSITTALWLSATSLLLCNSRGQLYSVDVREAADDAEVRRAGRLDSVAQTALTASLEVQLPVTSKEVEQLGLKSQQEAEPDTETETADGVVGSLEAKLVATLSSPSSASSASTPSPPLVALSSALTKQHVLLSTSEGSLLFLDPATCSPVLVLSVDSASPLSCIAFCPSYSDMLALSESGHLRLLHHTATSRETNLIPTPIAAATAASSSPSPAFSLKSLGHFTISPPSGSSAVSSSVSAAVSCSSCIVPCSFPSGSPRVSLMCSSAGLLEVWTYSPRSLLCSLRLPSPVTASTSSPDGQLCVLGLHCGTVCLLSLVSPSSPRLIYTQRLHSSAVLQLQYEGAAGRDAGLLCSCSAEELWWLRADDLRVVGWVKVRELLNGPQGADAARDKARMDEERRQREEDEAFFASLMQKQDGSSSAATSAASAASLEPDAPLTFTWLGEGRKLVLSSRQSQLLVLTAPPAEWESEDELLLPEPLLQPSFRRSDGVLSVLCRHSRGDRWYAGCGRDVLVYELKADVVRVVARSDGHYGDVSSLCLSPCGRLLLSGGEDGLIIARNAETLSVIAAVPAASFLTRGLSSLSASSDSEFLLSSARDGSSACWSLTRLVAHPLAQARYTQPLPAPAFPSTINPRVLEALPTLPFLPADSPSFLSQFAPLPTPSLPEELVAQRETLLSALSSLTILVNATRSRNAQLPSSATLPWSALVVDSSRRQELEAQSEREVAARAEEIEKEHRGAELVCERIVSECWDSMAVKGAVVKGLREGGEEVRNFGLRVRSGSAVWRMRQLQLLREMEICERRWRWTEQERQRKADSERERDLHSSTGSHSGSGGGAGGRLDAADPNYWSHRYCEGVEYILHSDDSQHADHQPDDDRAPAPAPGSATSMSPIMSPASKPKDGKKEGVGGSGGSSSSSKAAVRSCSITLTSDPASPTVLTFAIPAFYLYHPLDVVSPSRQRVQWLLLREKGVHCKLAFNSLFSDFHLQKQKDLATLSEKSRRLAEIAQELGVDGSGLSTLPRYELEDDEVSENVLRVRDDELRAGRGGDRGEGGSGLDDERSLETAAALQEMMNGSVECKRDLSLLEAELTPAEWMQKPAAEMTEEEKAELLRFEKKVKMIETEREQRRKTLQTEMNKVRSDMQDIGKAFDYKVRQMREQRQRSARDVLLIDWYMQRLTAAQARERAWRRECRAVERRRAECERLKDRLQARMQAFRSEVETEQAEYEALLADVRQLEKSVRKEVTDAGENYEHLCKLFRIKRIKFSTQHAQHQLMGRRGSALGGQPAGAGPRHRSRASAMSIANVSLHGAKASLFGIEGLTGAGLNPLGRKRRSVIEEKQHDAQHDGDELFSLSPYADLQPQQAEGGAAKEEEAGHAHPLPPVHMCDLDTAPPDMNVGVWSRFVERRRVVVEKEAEVRARLLRLQDMHRFYMRMQVVEEWAISGMEAAEAAGSVRQGQQLRACEWDVCLMLRIQQGLVELDDTDVVSVLSDVQLLGRAELSEVNAAIRLKGQQKLGLMRDMQTFSQQRRLLQWRHRLLQLQHEQALDVTTQLQLLRVTKDMQMQLKDREEGRAETGLGDAALDTAAIERKMDFVRAAVRSLNTDKQQELHRLTRRRQRLHKENSELKKRVEMLKEAVGQRQAIEVLREEGEREREDGERRKMREVVARRRLVDLARLQTEEITWLRGQVDGLRRKTFASFAGVKLSGSRRAEEEKQQLRAADGSRKANKEKRLILPAL